MNAEISPELIRKAGQGDRQAFRQIYDAYSSFVYTLCLRVLLNSYDAEEAAQDVFLKIYDKLKEFKGESSLKTWIYRVSVNTALNFVQKRNRYRNHHEIYEPGVTPEPQSATNAASSTEAADHRAELEKLLSRLSPEMRACLVMREAEGLTYEEIALALKININTAKTRVRRARKELMESRQHKEVAYGM